MTDHDDSDGVDDLMVRLRAKVAVLMGTQVEELDDQEELMDQGLDSVRLVEVVSFLREAGGQVFLSGVLCRSP